MERPDELTPEQLARMEAEEAIQDDMLEYLPLIVFDKFEAMEMIAEVIELALFRHCRKIYANPESIGNCDKERLEKLQLKCLEWFDMMTERKVHGMPK